MKSKFVSKFVMTSVFAIAATLSLHAAGTSVTFAAMVTPVPEPSTYVAGALMLIPLGAGLARAYFKSRKK